MPSQGKGVDEHLVNDDLESQEDEDVDVAPPAGTPVEVTLAQAEPHPAANSAPAAQPGQAMNNQQMYDYQQFDPSGKNYVAYTIKLPSDQLAALQTIWLELKRLYGTHSPDKSGMIQQAIADWLKRWDGPERSKLLQDLLEIRQETRRRQYRK